MRATRSFFAASLVAVFAAVAAAGTAIGTTGVAQAAESPQATVDALHEGLRAILGSEEEEAGASGAVTLFMPVAEETFDLEAVARGSVGKSRWNGWSEEERAAYKERFSSFLVATYASRFSGATNVTFEGGEVQLRDEKALVRTTVRRPGADEDLSIGYLLNDNAGDWRIVDVYLDGAISEVANWRSQFASVVREKGHDGLIALLDERTAALVEPR